MDKLLYIFLLSLLSLNKPISYVETNTLVLQKLLDKGGYIDLTGIKDTIFIKTLKGKDCVNALVISKETYLKFNNLKLIGTSDSTAFHLFSIKHGNFNVTIDGNCLPPKDGSPLQPSYTYKFPNLLDTWTYNKKISSNGDSRTITLKNSSNTIGYWCAIIKNSGGGYYDTINNVVKPLTFKLENINHITRSGGIKMFSGNRPYSWLYLKNVKLTQITKKGQKHHDHLGYIHETVNSRFENVELSGCHFDFRSTAWQKDGGGTITHYFKNLYMHDGLSMQIKNAGSTRTNSHTYFENSRFSAGNVYGYLTLKNTEYNGGSFKKFKSLGGNILSIYGNDPETKNIDLTNDSIKYMTSFSFSKKNAKVYIKSNVLNRRQPKVPLGKLKLK